jgi:ribosomal protein S18 acetylase RimI-like enzyme
MSRFAISRCSAAELQPALKCLHEGLSSDQQAMLVATLDSLASGNQADFSGLLVAKHDEHIVAATWVQFTSGSAAVVWPPSLDSPAARDLFSTAANLLDDKQTALAQILFSATDPIDEAVLVPSGFHRLADLAYLTLELANSLKRVETSLRFEPHADQQPERLGTVITQSYQASLDCPELNDLRTPAEVIAGYKLQGQFASNNWFLISADDADVGCLILAEHSPGENVELVYMGIVPEARGLGYGEEIVRFAVEQARTTSAKRLVLAVDERNAPALAMYRRVGFVMWDRRTVYARLTRLGV